MSAQTLYVNSTLYLRNRRALVFDCVGETIHLYCILCHCSDRQLPVVWYIFFIALNVQLMFSYLPFT